MRVSDYHKIVLDVCIEDYPVTKEAGADIVECLESGVCPLCSETASVPPFEMPKENEMADWVCSECNTRFSVESWITK